MPSSKVLRGIIWHAKWLAKFSGVICSKVVGNGGSSPSRDHETINFEPGRSRYYNCMHDIVGDEATGPGGLTGRSVVADALREMRVGLVQGNYFMYHDCVGALVRVTGQSFRTGMTTHR
jgi:hypothetical protein